MTDFFDINNTSNGSGSGSGSAGDGSLDLDALFSDARRAQPELADENFTKIVANSLPAKPARRREKKGLSFDLIGISLGLILAYFYFDVNRLVVNLLNLVPEAITLSPVHAIVAIGSVSVMSIAAWWAVENSRNL